MRRSCRALRLIVLLCGVAGCHPVHAPAAPQPASSQASRSRQAPLRTRSLHASQPTSQPIKRAVPDEPQPGDPSPNAPSPAEPQPGGAEPPATDELDGFATWYGSDWHGKPTASGDRFNKHKMTAAHRTLPLGSKIRVTNMANGRSVELVVNDRGPYGKRRERIVDVSEAAARQLRFINAGVCPVHIDVLWRPAKSTRHFGKKRKRKA